MSRKFVNTWHQGKNLKNREKKRKNSTFFFSVFFSFLRIREAKFVRDEICTFSMFGVHVVKKTMIFHTFFSIVFIPHLILRKKKCMTNWKKVHFLAFCLTLFNKKSFFQHFFCIFLTKKFSIFNFLPHYKKFHFSFFAMLILRQTSKKTSISLFLYTLGVNPRKTFFMP